MFDEYRPRGGWLRHYRIKKQAEDLKQVALLIFLAVIFLSASDYACPF